MVASNCCVPACSYSRKKKEKRSLFTIYRPDLAKSKAEKEHRQSLTNFILSLRDAARGDNIKPILRKENAAICEDHFSEEDVITKGKLKFLRCGAKPCKNLPKTNSFSRESKRKPTTERENELKQYHKNLEDVLKSYDNLNSVVKENWKFIKCNSSLNILMQECNILIPKFKLCIDENCSLKKIEVHGWPVKLSSHLIGSLQTTTLHAFLSMGFDVADVPSAINKCVTSGLPKLTTDQRLPKIQQIYFIENIQICEGIVVKDTQHSLIPHPILLWDGQKVVASSTFHSSRCTIGEVFLQYGVIEGEGLRQCHMCCALDQPACISTGDQRTCSSDEGISYSSEDGIMCVDEVEEGNVEGLNIENNCVLHTTIFSKDKSKLNPWQKLFLDEQLRHTVTHSKGRRYHPDVLRWCVELHSRSPAAYKLLTSSGVLALPARSTIAKHRRDFL